MKKKATDSKSKAPGKLAVEDRAAVQIFQTPSEKLLGVRCINFEGTDSDRRPPHPDPLPRGERGLRGAVGFSSLPWRERVRERGQLTIHHLHCVKALAAPISQKPSAKLALVEKGQTPSDQFVPTQISQTLSGKSTFTLSWSHYVLLLTIKNPEERSFYEIEATRSGWSFPELKRQLASGLYERLALSRDKKNVRKLAGEGQVLTRPEDMLKEPYVLEFLGR